ncbi:MAG: Sua5 family C-terminal domain-containing protein, partial [Bacteroidota bacterium]
HYAPLVPLRLFDGDEDLDRWLSQTSVEQRQQLRPSLLRFERECINPITVGWQQEILSPKGDVQEAAHNLFAALRRLEKISGLILAQKVPNAELGIAVNDRLFRASLKETL